MVPHVFIRLTPRKSCIIERGSPRKAHMGELKAADINRDIASIVHCEAGHPIGPIERLILAGSSALPRLH